MHVISLNRAFRGASLQKIRVHLCSSVVKRLSTPHLFPLPGRGGEENACGGPDSQRKAHGRDRGEAALRFQQAAKAHLEALLETGRPIPAAFRDKFVLAA